MWCARGCSVLGGFGAFWTVFEGARLAYDFGKSAVNNRRKPSRVEFTLPARQTMSSDIFKTPRRRVRHVECMKMEVRSKHVASNFAECTPTPVALCSGSRKSWAARAEPAELVFEFRSSGTEPELAGELLGEPGRNSWTCAGWWRGSFPHSKTRY